MSQIESQQNPRLKAVRRLHTKRERARRGSFLAEGEDLIAAARAAGRPLLEGYRLAGCGIGGEEFLDVERAALASVSALGSGTRVIGVYEQRWGAPLGPLRLPARRRRPRQRRHRAALRAGVRGVLRRARSRLRGPALAEGGAREHGRDLRRRARARR